MKRRSLILGGVIGTPIASLGLSKLLFSERPTDDLPDPAIEEEYIPTIEDMVQGSSDAKVILIEYASFTCSHCAAFHASGYQKLKSDYIDTGKIKYVYRDVFFDRFGVWASMVARCGGENKFFGISEMIYKEQKKWAHAGSPSKVADELRKIGLVAGLDPNDLEACMQDKSHAEDLVRWYQHNAKVDDINSTPSFVIGGKTYKNMAYDKMQKLIEDELSLNSET